jgi:hypothetical protein
MPHEEWEPEGWELPHLLSFVTNESGTYIAVHADLAGISCLIGELECLREQLLLDDCPHTHLWSGRELTNTKLADQGDSEVNVAYQVKIYGCNQEWAKRHGLIGPAGQSDNT